MRSSVAITFAALLLATTAVPAPADEPWATEMARFDAQDRDQPTEQGGVVFVGSSSIRLWDLKKSFPKLDALNRGFGGSEIADSVRNIDRLVLRHKPRTVVLYAGDNDISHGKSPEQVADDFKAFVTAVHKSLPKTKIVYIAIKPSIARWKLAEQIRDANARIESNCKNDEKCEFVDVWPAMLGEDGKPKAELLVKDGLHMSDSGYAVWAKLLKPHLQ